jgi:GNAT superfamily N-acetyltransferase
VWITGIFLVKMKIKTLLRKATTEDINAIANVYLRSRKELVAFAPLIHTDESIHQWIRNNLLPEEQVMVAEENGMMIGMMSLVKDDGIGWIRQLYIHPDSVGHGVGTLMIQKAKAMLGSPIHLWTFQENIGARRFYERHGFLAIEFNDGSGNEENCPAILYEWIA